MTEQGKAATASGLRLGKYGLPRSLRQYLQTESEGHHTTDHPAERGVGRRSASLNGRESAIDNQTNSGTISKAMLEKRLRERGAHTGFPKRIDMILN